MILLAWVTAVLPAAIWADTKSAEVKVTIASYVEASLAHTAEDFGALPESGPNQRTTFVRLRSNTASLLTVPKTLSMTGTNGTISADVTYGTGAEFDTPISVLDMWQLSVPQGEYLGSEIPINITFPRSVTSDEAANIYSSLVITYIVS